MLNFSFYSPTEMIFGKDAESLLGANVKKYGGSKVLLVYGSDRVIKNGLMKKATDSLDACNIAWKTIGGVLPNPRLNLVREGIALALDFGADFFVAVGGGSVIDTTKAIAHGTANPDLDIWDDIWVNKDNLKKSYPIASILTFAAAGSESSDSAVITNTDINPYRKLGINTPLNRPKFALMNPELSYTVPAYQISCGTADIMMHTLERYFTRVQGNDLSDLIAFSVLKNAMKSGKAMLENPTDYHAASELMWTSSLSHNDLTGLGGLKALEIHALSMAISSDYDVAHGAALTSLWEAWAKQVLPFDEKRFSALGAELFGFDPELPGVKTVEAIRDFFKNDLNLPVKFSETEMGVVSAEKVEELTERVTKNGPFGSFKPLTKEDVKAIYEFANK